MKMKVLASSKNILLWDFVSDSISYREFYIGEIEESIYYDIKKINDKRIQLFFHIDIDSYTIFNQKQLNQLAKEIMILENQDWIGKKDLDIIKKGTDRALRENLYLKIEYI